MPSAFASAISCSKRMPGEHRVALLDVDLHLVLEPVALQEAVHRRHVVVVLVLGRLLRLRLDQDRALEADLVLVLDDQVEEPAELVELALQVGVEQRLVALAAAPEHVVRAAQPMRHVEHVFTCRGRVGEHFRIGIGRRARHVAAVGEQVRRAPEQLDAGLAIFRSKLSTICVEVLRVLGEARALGRTSASWKQKNGTPSISKNSNATSAFSSARSGVRRSNHGRSKVRPPNGSPPFQTNVCQ